MRIIQQTGFLTEVIKKEDYTNIPKFLNRILTIDLYRQNKMFDKYIEIFEALVDKAKEEGTFDEGVTDLKAESIRLVSTKTLTEDTATKAKTVHYLLEQDVKTEPVSFAWISKVQQVSKKFNNDLQGFYVNIRSKGVCYIYEIEPKTDVLTGSMERRFIKQTVMNKTNITLQEIEKNHDPITDNEAENLWNETFEKAPKTTTHEVNIIGGVVLPLWYKLRKVDNSEDKLRIVRTVTDTGQRIVGIKIPNKEVQYVIENFDTNKKFEVKQFDEIYARVIEYKETVSLAGNSDLVLRATKVYGLSRIELVNAKSQMHDKYLNIGLEKERMYGQTRMFFSYDKETAEHSYNELLKIYTPTH